MPNSTIRKILVPVDFSSHSQRALKQALAFAKAFSAEIKVLHVYHEKPNWADQIVTPLTLGQSAKDFDELLFETAKISMEKFLNAIGSETESVVTKVTQGVPSQAILKEAREENFDAIIMGRSGKHSEVSQWFLGSTVDRVLRQARCPVLVVSDFAVSPVERILTAIDFNKDADHVLKWPMCFKEAFQCDVEFVHVVEPVANFFKNYHLPEKLSQQHENESSLMLKNSLAKRFEEWVQSHAGKMHTKAHFLEGDVVESICEVAQEPTPALIVLTTHHEHPLEKMILGSTTEKILRQTGSPVWVQKA